MVSAWTDKPINTMIIKIMFDLTVWVGIMSPVIALQARTEQLPHYNNLIRNFIYDTSCVHNILFDFLDKQE